MDALSSLVKKRVHWWVVWSLGFVGIVIVLLVLLVIQNVFSLIRYKKLSSFHTYSAKLAAVFQGVFLLLLFFMPQVPAIFFYLAVGMTAIDLLEEIFLVLVLKEWTTDVRGLYWILKQR